MPAVALQIRGVPEEVRDVLAARAASRGQSLQAFLLDLVLDAAGRASNVAILDEIDQDQRGAHLTTGEILDALDTAREDRDRELSG